MCKGAIFEGFSVHSNDVSGLTFNPEKNNLVRPITGLTQSRYYDF